MWCLLMSLSQLYYSLLFIDGFILVGKTYLDIWTGSKGRVTRHLNPLFSGIPNELGLIQLRMNLSLKDSRFYLTRVNQLSQQCDGEVAYTNVPHQTGRYQVLHGFPGLGHRHLLQYHVLFLRLCVVNPFNWIFLLHGDVLQTYREMH